MLFQQPRPLSQEVGGIAAEQGGVADFVSVSAARLNDEVRLSWFGHSDSILPPPATGGKMSMSLLGGGIGGVGSCLRRNDGKGGGNDGEGGGGCGVLVASHPPPSLPPKRGEG